MPRNKNKKKGKSKFVSSGKHGPTDDPVSISISKDCGEESLKDVVFVEKDEDLIKDDFDNEFEISFIKEINDNYYDLLLVYHDTKYYLSVDEEFYKNLDHIFVAYPEILKKTVSENRKNIDFFTIRFVESNILLSCSIDLKLLVKDVNLLFVYKEVSSEDIISQLSSKLSRARYEIKKLKHKIDDIEEKEWIVFDYEFDSDEEEDLMKVSSCTETGITICGKDIYTGLDISLQEINQYEKIKKKYALGDRTYITEGGFYVYPLKRKSNITLNKKNDKFCLRGDIISDIFNNILQIPKGVLKSSTILLRLIRYELSYCSKDMKKYSKLTYSQKMRNKGPILPEIYITLQKIDEEDDDDEDEDFDTYQFCMSDNGVIPSEFNKDVCSDLFNKIKEDGIITYLGGSINLKFTDTLFDLE